MSYVIQNNSAPTIITDDTFLIALSVDIQTSANSSPYREIYAELKVDNVEVPIKNYSFNNQDDSIGTECSFTLADVYNDKSKITKSAVYDFRLGEKIAGENLYLKDDFENGSTIDAQWVSGTIQNTTQSGGKLILNNGGTTNYCFIETPEQYHFYDSQIIFDVYSIATGTDVVNEIAVVGTGTSDLWLSIYNGGYDFYFNTGSGLTNNSGVWDNPSKIKFSHDKLNAKINLDTYKNGVWTNKESVDVDQFFANEPLFSIYLTLYCNGATNAVGTFTFNRVYSTMFNESAVSWGITYTGQRLASSIYSEVSKIFSFSTVSGIADKLNLAPDRDLMIYDPNRSPFNATQVESQFDTAGNEYAIEDFPVSGLMLSDLFDEIFVNRCGFSSVVTDIEDFPIKQLSFPMGVSYWQSLKDVLTPFLPLVEEINNVLYVRDSTLAISSGYPAIPELTISGVIDYSLNAQYSTADAVRLTYQDQTNDYIETSYQILNTQYTEASTGDLIKLERWVLILTKRNNLYPNVIVDQTKDDFLRRHFRNSTLVKLEQISLTWDDYGRITQVAQHTEELVPDLNNPGSFVWRTGTFEETTNINFQQHPFEPAKQFIQSTTRQRTGLAVVDTDNPDEWSISSGEFVQAYEDAKRAGNIKSGQAYRDTQSLKTFIEKFEPQRNGLVTYRRNAFDHLADSDIYNWDEPRAGEVSIDKANNSKQNTLIVLPTDADTKGDGTFYDFDIKEIPLSVGIPLARRVLKKISDYPAKFSGNVIGYDLNIRRGYVFEAKDTNNVSQGYFIVEGYAGQGNEKTHTMSVVASQVAVTTDTNISSYQISIPSNTSVILTRNIRCESGYQLTSETVSDLTVEARHGSSGSWTNLESSALDLSTWNGSTESFQIRLTAATVASRTLKNFNLIIARP